HAQSAHVRAHAEPPVVRYQGQRQSGLRTGLVWPGRRSLSLACRSVALVATSVSTALTSLSLERAAARDTTLTAQQNSLPILWLSSCSSNCACGNGSWEGMVVIMCIRQCSNETARRRGCTPRDLAQIRPDVDQARSQSRKTDKIASSDVARARIN